jgi:hypothetical protein
MKTNGASHSYHMDKLIPMAFIAIHGAMAKAIVGSHYDPSKKVDFTLE